MYNGFDERSLYVGEKNILFVGKLYSMPYMVTIYVIYSSLRLFLYFLMFFNSPMWMNKDIKSVLIVEQLINIFG